MNKLSLAVASAAIGAALSLPAHAVDSNARKDEPDKGRQDPTQSMPAEKDEGRVSANAYWAMHAKGGTMSREAAMRFSGPDGHKIDVDRLDANHDGKISEDEWTAYHLATTGAGASAAKGGGKETAESPQGFWAMHAKGGSLSKDEAMRYMGPQGRKIDVDKLDSNHDGTISEQEWTAYHQSQMSDTRAVVPAK